jgi:hypothetical protein
LEIHGQTLTDGTTFTPEKAYTLAREAIPSSNNQRVSAQAQKSTMLHLTGGGGVKKTRPNRKKKSDEAHYSGLDRQNQSLIHKLRRNRRGVPTDLDPVKRETCIVDEL